MADQNITELPIKTNSGVASTDYMLGIDSAEGYQILVRDVAKYIMENYNGSSLAGVAQTPKVAIDTLNSKLSESTQIQSGSFNNLTATGYYFVYPQVENDPVGNNTYFWRVKVETYSGAQTQYANRSGSSDIYVRYKSNNVWSAWEMLPTRAEITELNSNMNSNVYSLLIGTAIASGANLNTYTTAGNFYAAGGAITNSLSNAPFTGYGFKMHVEYINSDGAILQTIISGHTPAKHYERRGQRASGAWTFSDWRLLF